MFVWASACASVHPSIPRILTLALFLSDPAATPSPRGGGLPQGWGKGLRGVSPREGLCPPPLAAFLRAVWAAVCVQCSVQPQPYTNTHTHSHAERERERERRLSRAFFATRLGLGLIQQQRSVVGPRGGRAV